MHCDRMAWQWMESLSYYSLYSFLWLETLVKQKCFISVERKSAQSVTKEGEKVCENGENPALHGCTGNMG